MTKPDDAWVAVDQYMGETLIPTDSALDAALEDMRAGGLPAINVAAAQGKLLYLLAKSVNAGRILEIGTLGGYSTIFLARAVAGQRVARDGEQGGPGEVVTLEMDPHHAEVARKNIDRAQLAKAVEIKVGKAVDTLPHLAGVFDFIFIDADKVSIPVYYDWALKLSRSGSLILVDNVVRGGAVVNAGSTDPSVIGVRRFNQIVAGDNRVEATTIQTVGAKGYDGFTLLRVK